MAQTQREDPPNKVLVLAVAALLLSVVGSAAILAYLGLFNAVTVQHYSAPAYRIAYLDHTGPYEDLQDVFDRVAGRLHQARITALAPCALLLDDPSVAAKNELRSKIGFLVDNGVSLHGDIHVLHIPPREVARARFRGSPVIGSYKAYAAMKQWGNDHGYTLSLPAFEIYHDDGEVEYQLPVTAQQR
ncbi:MAG TPA: GyrI-like domain-containing protein [Gammaproteobacteria bacterium]|nr:GyrI-like domain-containing protein [Gammaproteobacteria bacterium]